MGPLGPPGTPRDGPRPPPKIWKKCKISEKSQNFGPPGPPRCWATRGLRTFGQQSYGTSQRSPLPNSSATIADYGGWVRGGWNWLWSRGVGGPVVGGEIGYGRAVGGMGGPETYTRQIGYGQGVTLPPFHPHPNPHRRCRGTGFGFGSGGGHPPTIARG